GEHKVGQSLVAICFCACQFGKNHTKIVEVRTAPEPVRNLLVEVGVAPVMVMVAGSLDRLRLTMVGKRALYVPKRDRRQPPKALSQPLIEVNQTCAGPPGWYYTGEDQVGCQTSCFDVQFVTMQIAAYPI